RYDGPTSDDDSAAAIAVDSSENVHVTGGSAAEYATVKYNSTGQEQWVAQYASGSASAIAGDASDNVYVTGTGSGDYVTIKYDSGGQEQWVARYDASSNDTAEAIAVDAQGNVYVTGLSGPGNGFLITRLSSMCRLLLHRLGRPFPQQQQHLREPLDRHV